MELVQKMRLKLLTGLRQLPLSVELSAPLTLPFSVESPVPLELLLLKAPLYLHCQRLSVQTGRSILRFSAARRLSR